MKKAVADIRLRPCCAIAPSISWLIIDSSNSLAIKRLPLSCACRCMDKSNSPLLGVLSLSGRGFPRKLAHPRRGSSPPYVTYCSSCQAHSSPQTASRSVQPFLYRSRMLCYNVNEENTKITPSLGISSPCWRITDPRP